MMTRASRNTLIAALALIAISNAVVLVGVAYNRTESTSTLRLTQRELTVPSQWRGFREDSGLALGLQWRVLEADKDLHYFGFGYARSGGTPEWLDKTKLEALGFTATQLEKARRSGESGWEQPSREVLLVLEFDGPVYQASVERAKRYSELPSARDAKERKNILEREQRKSSRLFVVDAGLDAEALRTKYPDRSRYAFVRGQVQPRVQDIRSSAKVRGFVTDVGVQEISVPLEFREVFDFVQYGGYSSSRTESPPYEVTVTFGKRLEPWISAASRAKQ